MTMRERMLRTVQGLPVDRRPFVQYSNLAAPNEEIWQALGRDQMGLLQWLAAATYHTANCRFEREDFERDGVRGWRSIMHTPAGSLTQEKLIEPGLGTAATARHFVRRPDDYRVLLAYLRDTEVRPNTERIGAAVEALGDDGLPHVHVRRTPYQQLWVEWVSLEHLALHLADACEPLAEVMEALRSIQTRTYEAAVEVARAVPLPWIVFPDNLTAPAIGVRYFRTYCLPAYAELRERLDAAGLTNVRVHGHFDGDLRPLWPDLRASMIRGIDSLSPPPDNDTSVADAIDLNPELAVFPNFPSSVHLAAPENIEAVARQLLEQADGHPRFWIQISENVPPGRWKVSYPAIVRAINRRP